MHTQGPWHVEIDKSGKEWRHEIRTVTPHNPAGHYGKHIATVNAWLEAKDKGNAALLAAAPDLREALELAQATIVRLAPEPRHGFSSVKGSLDVIKAAIAKAKGA